MYEEENEFYPNEIRSDFIVPKMLRTVYDKAKKFLKKCPCKSRVKSIRLKWFILEKECKRGHKGWMIYGVDKIPRIAMCPYCGGKSELTFADDRWYCKCGERFVIIGL